MEDWIGVTINTEGRVTRLDLPNNMLNGSLTTEISRLTELIVLDLSDNHLRGRLPVNLGGLLLTCGFSTFLAMTLPGLCRTLSGG